MSILDYRAEELIQQRKKISDEKSCDERLSIPESSKKNGKQAGAYQKSRVLRDKLDIENIILSKDDETYFNDLMGED